MQVGLFNMDEYNDLRHTGVSVVTDEGFIISFMTAKEKRRLKMSRNLPLFFDSLKILF